MPDYFPALLSSRRGTISAERIVNEALKLNIPRSSTLRASAALPWANIEGRSSHVGVYEGKSSLQSLTQGNEPHLPGHVIHAARGRSLPSWIMGIHNDLLSNGVAKVATSLRAYHKNSSFVSKTKHATFHAHHGKIYRHSLAVVTLQSSDQYYWQRLVAPQCPRN